MDGEVQNRRMEHGGKKETTAQNESMEASENDSKVKNKNNNK